MDSKQKNILRASVRVIVAATAAALAWASDAIFWFIGCFSNNDEKEQNQDFEVVIEDGYLKSKGGGQEAILEILDDPRNKN